ncbi:MAG: peptidoglycan DD-metalloendopeptidase family protein [Candidatus Eisenbacteria bacterium]|uniref:Peptidoglycan DD-metalloendopeptidase family protein n=1 Tax=Eiseniibacteriota bacterium TaxID=2212470 RepID=A0A956RMW6_UNCEI|nr:peptidoglycan DD-metalloendopeptidase family protein [Candidatus Eisenbacteria bacterium]
MTRSCAKAGPGPRAGARRTTLGWIAVAVIALCVGVGNPGWGADVDARRAELEKLKGQIESNRGEIEKLRAREAEKEQLQVTIDRDRDLTRRYLEQLAAQERDLRDSQSERQKDLLALEVRIDETTDRLRRRLLHYYKLRHVKGGELLFSSNSFPEVFARSQFLVRMIEHDRVDLLALAQDRAEAARVSSQITERRQELDGLIAEKKREETRLAAEHADVGRQLAGIQSERQAHEARLRELEETQSRIRKLLEQLEKARSEGSGPAVGGDFAKLQGRLRWPVRGRVVAEFGFEVHPKYGTKVPQNGIIIAAPEGTPIQAAASGRVEFVDWYDGYGRTVILNHGGGFYTLYAHASAVLVHRGDTVTAGEEIARVGDTDSVRGFCLHFEVRRQQDALDPRDWLSP